MSHSFTSLRTLVIWRKPQRKCSERDYRVVAERLENHGCLCSQYDGQLMVMKSKKYAWPYVYRPLGYDAPAGQSTVLVFATCSFC